MRPESDSGLNENEGVKQTGDALSVPETSEKETSSSTKAKARCPECGEELDYLECYTTAKYYYYPDGTFEYIEMADGWEKYGDYYFICPECEAELAMSIEEADEILGRRKETVKAQEERAGTDEKG
jgi:ssDNA-binding Zn-finger/Zn-ribbon topoisomerase 1